MEEGQAGGPELVGGLLAAAQEEVSRLRTANMLLAEAAARCTSPHTPPTLSLKSCLRPTRRSQVVSSVVVALGRLSD